MSKRPESKATSGGPRQVDQDIEEYSARHKITMRIQQQLDRLDPNQYTYQTGIVIELQRKAVFDEKAAKFQRLADEQTEQSKAAQQEIDRIKENGEKAFNDAKVALLIKLSIAEASLLRAKSRVFPDLQKSLKGTKYERVPASESESDADIDDEIPTPKKIQAPSSAKQPRKGPFFKGYAKTNPSGSSSRIDAIDIDESD